VHGRGNEHTERLVGGFALLDLQPRLVAMRHVAQRSETMDPGAVPPRALAKLHLDLTGAPGECRSMT